MDIDGLDEEELRALLDAEARRLNDAQAVVRAIRLRICQIEFCLGEIEVERTRWAA
jgi:hypothetical protein